MESISEGEIVLFAKKKIQVNLFFKEFLRVTNRPTGGSQVMNKSRAKGK
jgi:hypothetical protein